MSRAREPKRLGRHVRKVKADRPAKQRCPKCKKLRVWWIRANAYHAERIMPARIEPGGRKVCHVCQKEEGSCE